MGPLATCQRGHMLSHTSKDTTTVCKKSNIAWCMPIPMWTTEELGEKLVHAHIRPKNSQWRDVHWLAWLCREVLSRTRPFFPSDQYSSGTNMIVAERSASVSTQIRSPALMVYADRMRNPCSTATSFSCLSAS